MTGYPNTPEYWQADYARKYARGRRRPARASKPVKIRRRGGKPPSSVCVVLILATAGIPAHVSVITL